MAEIAIVEALGQFHFESPWQTRLCPAGAGNWPEASASGTVLQMSRRPSRSPSTAYFRKLEGMNCVWPHGAGPGTEHGIAADMVLLEDLERRDQLAPKEIAPVAREGEGRESLSDVDRAREGAEIGLHAPDTENDRPRHPIGALDCIEGLRPFRGDLSSPFETLGGDRAADVLQIGLTNSDCFLVSATIFGSGTTPRKASSKVARRRWPPSPAAKGPRRTGWKSPCASVSRQRPDPPPPRPGA